MSRGEVAHYGFAHFCAGCPVSNKLHTGCVVEGNVRVLRTPQSKTFPDEEKNTQADELEINTDTS